MVDEVPGVIKFMGRKQMGGTGAAGRGPGTSVPWGWLHMREMLHIGSGSRCTIVRIL